MKYVIIDPSSITERAALLTIADSDVKVFMPQEHYDSCFTQISESRVKSRALKSIHHLLSEAKTRGTVTIVDIDYESEERKESQDEHYLREIKERIGSHKVLGIALALRLRNQHPNSEIVVSTIDDDIKKESRNCGLETMLPFATDKIFLADAKRDQEMAEVAGRFEIGLSIAFVSPAIVAGLLAYFAKSIYSYLVPYANVWFIVIALPLLAIFLYWFRSKQRLAYGGSEFVFGLVLSIRVFYPSFDLVDMEGALMLQLLGGLFVMVRGLDNIGKGIKGSMLERRWRQAFG